MTTTPVQTLTTADAEQIARELYGRVATATHLNGELDDNFLLTAQGQPDTVLKVSRSGERRSLLELQGEALQLLSRVRSPVKYEFPRVIPIIDGTTIGSVPPSLSGAGRFVRLLSRVAGKHLAEASPASPPLLASLGTLLSVAAPSTPCLDA